MIPRAVLDGALDGLALVENSVDNNPINRAAILKQADTVHLVTGLVLLASMLRSSLAANTGESVERVDEVLRAALLAGES